MKKIDKIVAIQGDSLHLMNKKTDNIGDLFAYGVETAMEVAHVYIPNIFLPGQALL